MKNKTMCITATEFKSNLGKYLELGETTEILIMKNGRVKTRLVPASIDVDRVLDEIAGCVKEDGSSLEEAKADYFNKKYGYHL